MVPGIGSILRLESDREASEGRDLPERHESTFLIDAHPSAIESRAGLTEPPRVGKEAPGRLHGVHADRFHVPIGIRHGSHRTLDVF